MIGRGRHPRWAELNRLADGELSAERRRRVAEHAAGCRRCASRLAWLAKLHDAAGGIRHPSPPRDLLRDVLRSREAGERVILPAAPVRRHRSLRLPAAVAAATLVAAAGLATLIAVSEAGAGASDLRFDPAAPVAASEIEVTYRAGTELAGRPQLRLRYRLRPADEPPPRASLGPYGETVLRHLGDGVYEGRLSLPASMVYGVFSVEDPSGQVVDDRGGRLWELMLHDGSGAPLVDALRQQFLVRQYRAWPSAGETARQMTLLYPERPEGWSLLYAHELPALLPGEVAASTAKHREMFRSLQERALRSDSLDVADVAGLARYARSLGDVEAVRYWTARLEAREPTHPLAVSSRVEALFDDPRAVDAYLEKLWSEAGARGFDVYDQGLRAGTRLGDPEVIERWARRGLRSTADVRWASGAAVALVSHAETRAAGLEAVRALLARLARADAAGRPLQSNRIEAAEEGLRRSRELRVELGKALVRAGDTTGALRQLREAERLGGWQPDLYLTRHAVRLARSDTAGALLDAARVQVDPVFRLRADSIAPLAIRVRPGGDRLAAARREMIERVLGSLPSVPRPVPDGVLKRSDGSTVRLHDLIDGRPTLLVLWDRRDGESPEAVGLAESLLGDGPTHMVWLTPESHGGALEAFVRSARLASSPYEDSGGRVATELGEWSSRAFYVIDGSGRIRTRTSDLMEAVRLLEILNDGGTA